MQLQHKFNTKAPLLSWDFFCAKYNALMDDAEKYQQSALSIKKIAKLNKWDKPQTVEALDNLNRYAIVITNNLQEISFTCHGFEKMSGYSFDEAKGKNPNFLQGDATNRKHTHLIKERLANNEISETVLGNYRKDGELYLCKIIIKPIININKKLVNFIAYEEEIAA